MTHIQQVVVSLVQCSLTEPATYPKTAVDFLEISCCAVKVLIYIIVVMAQLHPGQSDESLGTIYMVSLFVLLCLCSEAKNYIISVSFNKSPLPR